MMLRRIFLAGFSVLALASVGFATETRVVLVGVMSDSHCGLQHAQASADAAKCVISCASKDADYVLVSNGKIYKFAKKDPFYKNFAGKNVEVIGTLTEDTFGMSDIALAEILGDPPKNLQLFEGTMKSSGGKYTLESGGKVYQLDGETAVDKGKDFADLVGQMADVAGTLDGITIHVHDAQSR
jgi:hypothetical protein